MQVNFYATLRQIVGGKTIELPWEAGTTAAQVLEQAITRFPALREQLLDAQGQLYGHVHFLVNGRDIRFLENRLETALQPEDVISIFPAVGGG
jgi:sulfur-carrier protein